VVDAPLQHDIEGPGVRPVEGKDHLAVIDARVGDTAFFQFGEEELFLHPHE
jgi:hypothetical protein